MKKLLITIVAIFLPMLAMGQTQSGTLLAEVNYASATGFSGWVQFGNTQTDAKVDLTYEGLAITVGIQAQNGQFWMPLVEAIPEGSFNLKKARNYKVVVTAKFPTDGTLQIIMGTWNNSDLWQFPVSATGNFQEIVCEFPDWPDDDIGSHLIFCCGNFKGKTILKKIQVIELDDNEVCYNYNTKAKIAEVIPNPNGKYNGNVEIPATVQHEGVEYSVTKITDNAFNGCTDLTSVTIPNSVTNIGNYAFKGCSGLTSITIPNSVSSIGWSAFSGCSGLSSVIIPNSVNSIGGSAFSGCNNLTSVTFPNSFISITGNAFENCGNLKHVYISDLEVWCDMNSNIPNPYHIYLNGEEIINLTIPNSITSISAFANCAFIESVNIGSSVTSIGSNAFFNCTSLSSIKLPSNLTSIEGGAFEGCTSLASIDIPSNVTSIGVAAFEGCISLTSVTIPNSVTSIKREVFQNCSSLASISIGNGVKSIGSSAFANCDNLANVYCMVEDLSSLSTATSAFDGSYIDYASLHVPASAINAYKTTAPWSGFGEFKTLSGEAIETKKCATPTISFENGEIVFSCETEGVEYVSNISAPDAKAYYDGRLKPTYKFKVTVYATKSGFDNSEIATAEFSATGVFGDLNGDGKVNVADHVKLSSIIMDQNE